MAIKYWIANEPNSSITSSQAKYIAVLARNLESTTLAAKLGANTSRLAPLATNLASVTVAGYLGKNASTIAGGLETNKLIFSSKIADIASYVIDITQAPVSGVITTSTTGAAGGTAITFTSEVGAGVIGGYIKIRLKTSTGGTVYRYLAMFTTTESS